MSPIPTTSREALLDAMARFDREERGSLRWQTWQQGQFGTHRFAIVHDGRRYPVKQIISLASGVASSDFYGGDQANTYLQRYGFQVESLQTSAQTRVWWVNQGQTYESERAAGIIHAHVKDARGYSQKHWDSLEQVQEDDIIVHYRGGFIVALGRARGQSEPEIFPDGRPARSVPVEYAELSPPVWLDTIAPQIHALNLKDGPLVESGDRPKQAYLMPFSIEGLRAIRTASTASWPAWAEVAVALPRAWIFQGNPSQFDIEAALRELPQIDWAVRQHASEITAGDRIFFWVSGADAGVLAMGTVLEAPSDRESDPAEQRFYRDPSRFQGVYRQAPVRIDQILPERIRRGELREHPVLHDLTILQLAQGTNFKVTPQQAAALLALVSERSPLPPKQPKTGPLAPPDLALHLDDLLASLKADGLFFSPEVVSNYLLALQTKRFVILTGISGTGKTQLALAVARAFQPRLQVDATRGTTEGAVEQIVQPYMVKYHRLVLPQALRARMTLPALAPETISSSVDVIYPAGKTSLRFNVDPNRPVVQLLFSGEFRAWFDSTLQVGDRFQLDVVPREGDDADSLRFSLPIVETREQPLNNYRVIAVRPDWTDNRGVLGYHNPLAERYTTTPLLDLLLDAAAESERARREGRSPYPYFAILDEMNLAHVEHYFSDFLSAMESGETLDLHADATLEAGEGADGVRIPRRLKIPSNVFFTGTVNVDETTSMFSPKVLDRAFTIELDQVDLDGYGRLGGKDDLAPTAGADGALTLGREPISLGSWQRPSAEDWQELGALRDGALQATVVELHALLARSHRHFGYRVANEIARFVTLAAAQAGSEGTALDAALDLAILEKVLPKFHGTQQELEEPLLSLFTFLIHGTSTVSSAVRGDDDVWMLDGGRLVSRGAASSASALGTEPEVLSSDAGDAHESGGAADATTVAMPPTTKAGVAEAETSNWPPFPRSAAKVRRMLERLRQQGFTSFIE